MITEYPFFHAGFVQGCLGTALQASDWKEYVDSRFNFSYYKTTTDMVVTI